MNIVMRQIRSTLTRETMTTFKDANIDGYIFHERLEAMEKAMKLLISVEDAWAMTLGLVKMWMPNPSRSGEMAYDSPEYNTVEIFCICVRKAYNEREA